jgi:transcriptional regulator with XRE-family HTH domain
MTQPSKDVVKEAVAAAVRQAVARTGLEKDPFARAAGIDRSTLANISGGGQDPGITRLYGIARAAGWTMEFMGRRIDEEVALREEDAATSKEGPAE